MSEAVIEAGKLKVALNAVGVLVDTCRLRFRRDGVEMTGVEPGNVLSTSVHIDRPAFGSFDVDRSIHGVDVARLWNVVRSVASSEPLRREAEGRTLRVRTERIEYSTRLIDPGVLDERRSLDSIDLPARATLARDDFERILDVTAGIAETVAFGYDGTEKSCYARADGEFDAVHVEFDASDRVDVEVDSVRSRYSLDYLRRIEEAVPRDSPVTIRLGEGSPAEIRYGFADGDGSAIHYLAPRRRT